MEQGSAAAQDMQQLHLLSMKEVLDTPQPDVEYLVEDRLILGGLSIFAAKPKTGKSTLCRQLVVAVAQGTEFLGTPTHQGGVIYLALEEKLSEVQAHLKLLGAKEDDPIYIHAGTIDRSSALKRLEHTLSARKDVVLVVIDPIFKFLGGIRDADDYVQVDNGLTPLLNLARRFDVHIATVHHLKKRISDDVMDGVLGSTAILGAVDASIALVRQPNGIRTIASRQRYGQELAETQLVWDDSKRRMTLGVTADEASIEEAQRTARRIQDEIIEYVASNDGVTQDQVLAAITGKTAIKKRMFNEVSKNFFDRVGAGVKGDPYIYRSAQSVLPEAVNMQSS